MLGAGRQAGRGQAAAWASPGGASKGANAPHFDGFGGNVGGGAESRSAQAWGAPPRGAAQHAGARCAPFDFAAPSRAAAAPRGAEPSAPSAGARSSAGPPRGSNPFGPPPPAAPAPRGPASQPSAGVPTAQRSPVAPRGVEQPTVPRAPSPRAAAAGAARGAALAPAAPWPGRAGAARSLRGAPGGGGLGGAAEQQARRSKSMGPGSQAGAAARGAGRPAGRAPAARRDSSASSSSSGSSSGEEAPPGRRGAPVPLDCCAGCRKPITGRFVKAGGAEFHEGCFACGSCSRPIDGSYVLAKDGSFLCRGCQPRCPLCMEPLAGSSVIKLDGRKIHSACFRCSDCKSNISGGHFKVAEFVYRCTSCHKAAWQARENRKDAHAASQQRHLKRQNTSKFRLAWRGELVPSSVEALSALGVPPQLRPRGELVCICHDARSNRVACAPSPGGAPESAVNVSYLACALKVLGEYGREPSFSLDPKDPHSISGETQVKVFYPPWLAATVVGEVLFQADYALKEVCLGDRALPGIPNAFGELTDAGEEKAARQWFVVRKAAVTVAADGTLVPHCQMGVDSRRLVPSPKGYTDAPYTDPGDPMVQVAKAISDKFSHVARELPAVAELIAVAKAIIVARYLLQNGCQYDKSVVGSFKLPRCPEGDAYTMEIPTLRNTHSTSVISEADGQLSMHRATRSMHGGVDLGIPEKKIPAVKAPQPLLGPGDVRAPLPLFVQPTAAAAA